MYLAVNKPQNRLGFFGNGLNTMFEDFFNVVPWSEEKYNWAPRADIHETEDKYIVQLDLPGVDKNDVKVKVDDNVLMISGERKSEHKTDDENYHRLERFSGSFSRSFRLHSDIKADEIKADFKNGVLEVSIPKIEEVKPREIEVN